MYVRLRTSQETGANLDCAGAERHSSRNTPRISDTSCGDDGDSDRINNGRNQGKQSDELSLRRLGVEAAAVAAQ
jgi:hypothetical protein